MKSFRYLLLAAYFAISSVACAENPQNSQVGSTAYQDVVVHRELITHPDDSKRHIEFYWTRPEGDGPWPVVIYIHGHQEPERPGGKDLVDAGVLQKAIARGMVAVSVSQPGYGQSDGPPDYCGPFTQNAIIGVIAEGRKWKFVLPEKVALSGVSRGAIVASMVEVKDPRLAAVVLVSGVYDLVEDYKKLKEGARTSEELAGILENMTKETGVTENELKDRSALLHANSIKSPTLILNGETDDRTAPKQSLLFGAKLQKNGIPSKVVIYPGVGHFIPFADRAKEIIPFLVKYLGIKGDQP